MRKHHVMSRRFGGLVLVGGISFVVLAWVVVLSLYAAVPSVPSESLHAAHAAAAHAAVGSARPPALRARREPEETRVRGAAAEAQRKYQLLRREGGFQCFDGSKSFSTWAMVNDDYCDCADGSDEPGTAACAGVHPGSFACNWAQGGDGGPLVHLSTVDDGFCDCCAGQDEATGACPDRCEELAAAEAKSASLAMEGSHARQDYVRRAKELRQSDRFKGVDGGPEDVYLAVAEAGCVKLNDVDFEFEVCLFERVTQRDLKSNKKFQLGHHGKWATALWENGQHRTDYTKLVMDQGDFCAPAKKHREVEISFECSPKPLLLSVQETQVCSYTARMQTPAACPAIS